MRLILDHHYPRVIATRLRERGHDVVAVIECGWHDLEDESLLEQCAEAQAVLLTNNVADFAVLARTWQVEGRSHAGLVFTSDGSWPRTMAASGALISALDDLLRANPESASSRDVVRWL